MTCVCERETRQGDEMCGGGGEGGIFNPRGGHMRYDTIL